MLKLMYCAIRAAYSAKVHCLVSHFASGLLVKSATGYKQYMKSQILKTKRA